MGTASPHRDEAARSGKELLRRHFEEVLNAGHLDVIDEIYAAEYVLDAPVSAGGTALDLGQTRGREELKSRVTSFRVAFPDIHFVMHDVVAEADAETVVVAVRYSFSGTHRGSFVGVEPVGNPVVVPGILMARVRGGLIEQAWSGFDSADMVRQLKA